VRSDRSHPQNDVAQAVSESSTGHAEDGGEGNWLISYADMMTLLVGFFVILLSFSRIDAGQLEELKKSATREFGGIYQMPYGDISDRIKSELNKLGLDDQFFIKQTDLGVEISFIGTVFFATGLADLKPQGRELLGQLVPIVKAEAHNFNIVIEGHTDDVPLTSGSQFKNNWELSSIRACRVLEAFEKSGVPKMQLTALGFGEARPVVANRDSAGNAISVNQSQNRRVVIKLLKQVDSLVGDLPVLAPSAAGAASTE
jgi:chemotaxis protein MotB